MRDRLILEHPEEMCEYCCNFDKEHIGMDGTALCKLTMTLAYAEDYGGNCMFYNVPKEQIIVPPCKVGDKVFFIAHINDTIPDFIYYDIITKIGVTTRGMVLEKGIDFADFGKTVFLTKEQAEKALAERVKDENT